MKMTKKHLKYYYKWNISHNKAKEGIEARF